MIKKINDTKQIIIKCLCSVVHTRQFYIILHFNKMVWLFISACIPFDPTIIYLTITFEDVTHMQI